MERRGEIQLRRTWNDRAGGGEGLGERGKREEWVSRRDSDPLRTLGKLRARAGIGALARAGHWEAAAETLQDASQALLHHSRRGLRSPGLGLL